MPIIPAVITTTGRLKATTRKDRSVSACISTGTRNADVASHGEIIHTIAVATSPRTNMMTQDVQNSAGRSCSRPCPIRSAAIRVSARPIPMSKIVK